MGTLALVDGAEALLAVLLALDALQLVAALVALEHGRRRTRREEHALARYSRQHAALLAAGALVLAVPAVLGLADVISDRVAVIAVVVGELLAIAVARPLLARWDRQARVSDTKSV